MTPTGGWDTYKVMTGNLTKELSDGEQILRFTINGANCNIDKVELKCTKPNAIEMVAADQQPRRAVAYNLAGQKVSDSYKGIVVINGRKVLRK